MNPLRQDSRVIDDGRVDLYLCEVCHIRQVRALKFGALKNSVLHVRHPQVGAFEVRKAKIRSHQIRDAQVRVFQIRALQIDLVKIGLLQNRFAQICTFAFLAVAFDPPLVIRQYFSKFHDDEQYIVEPHGEWNALARFILE